MKKKVPKLKVVVSKASETSVFFNIDCLNGKFWMAMSLKDKISEMVMEKTKTLTVNNLERCMAEIDEILAEETKNGIEEGTILPFMLNKVVFPNQMISWALLTKHEIRFPRIAKKFLRGYADHHIVRGNMDFHKRLDYEIREKIVDIRTIKNVGKPLSATRRRIFEIIKLNCKPAIDVAELLSTSTIDYSKFKVLQNAD